MGRSTLIFKALRGEYSWQQVQDEAGLSARHLRRLVKRCKDAKSLDEVKEALRDRRAGRAMPERIPATTVATILQLRQERAFVYLPVRAFHQILVEDYHLQASYTFVRALLKATQRETNPSPAEIPQSQNAI